MVPKFDPGLHRSEGADLDARTKPGLGAHGSQRMNAHGVPSRSGAARDIRPGSIERWTRSRRGSNERQAAVVCCGVPWSPNESAGLSSSCGRGFNGIFNRGKAASQLFQLPPITPLAAGPPVRQMGCRGPRNRPHGPEPGEAATRLLAAGNRREKLRAMIFSPQS